MTNNQVAIIIPTLNEELFIDGCIRSVLTQTYPIEKMDIMIIDGGSTDKTAEIVLSFHNTYPNIRLLQNPNRIQSVAFNIGVENSTAPIIIRLDAHATYECHYIERCVTLLAEHSNYGNVGGAWDILPQNQSLIAQANALLNHLRFGIGGAAYRVDTEAKEVDSVPFGAFRRDIIEKVGFMREDLARGEDNEYNSRIRKAGFIIWFDPKIRSTYFARATWLSSCRQMYANGVSIGKLVYIDRNAVGIRHLVPLVFVLSLLISLSISIFTIYGFFLFAAIFGAYLLAALIADIDACRKYGWKFILILPLLFISVHISYGWGTLIGLIKH